MRARDAIATMLTMLVFSPALMADDQTPETKDQPQAQTEQQNQQQQKDQPKAEQQRNEEDQENVADSKMQESMAACLALSNHAEIEMAKVALDKSQDADVKALAEEMLNDHTKAAEQLKQFMPRVNVDADQDDAQNSAQPADEKHEAMKNHDPMQRLMQKIAKNELAMTKDVLMRYEGQDFDMGYLGQQILAHTQLLAKLHAMKDQGSTEFQTAVKDMIPTVEHHFQQASHLSHQLEGRDDRPARTTASTTNDNTRRALSAQPEAQDNAGNQDKQPAAPKEQNLEKAGDRQEE